MEIKEETFHFGVKALIRNEEKKILLLKKNDSRHFWDLPGGRLQKGENLLDALSREIKEEVGLQFETAKPLHTFLAKNRIRLPDSDVGLILMLYLIEVKTDFVPTLSSEHTDFGWFPFEEIEDKIQILPARWSEALKPFC